MSESTDRRLDKSFERTTKSGPIPLTDNLALIRANELAQYSFCHRAWWLSTVHGIPSHNQAVLARGVQTHRRHGNEIRAALRWRRASFFLLGGGGLLLIMAVFYYFLL
jgi:hypothetical protein